MRAPHILQSTDAHVSQTLQDR
eukprot:COSAG02_NODE_39813_length_412_cov_1.290735_1_plen_21_part_10